MADINARTRLLTGTPADWAANDLVLGLGELVIESVGTLVKFKAGDGSTRYSGLPFVTAVPDIPPEYVTQDEGDARYLQLAGISMTSTPNLVPRMGANGMLDAAMIPLPPAIAVTTGIVDAGKLIKTAPTGKLDLTFLPAIIATSAGAPDADKLVKTNLSGKVDLTFLPPIIAVSAGAADAGKLVKTAASGKIDPSLITITTGKYKGTADGTAARPAGTYIAGDYFINSGSGLADASWGLPVDTVVVPNQQLYFNGSTWDVVGSGDTSVMLLPDGTAAMPGLGFLADQSTGLWRPNSRSLGISVGGLEKMRANAPTATDAELLVGLPASVQSPAPVAGHGLLELAGSNHARINLDAAGVVAAFFFASSNFVQIGSVIAKPLALWTANAEKARLTESADAQLLVGNTSAIAGGTGRGLVNINGTSDAALVLASGNTMRGYLLATTGGMTVDSEGSALLFSLSGQEKVRIPSGTDSQLLVGTPTTSLTSAGRGVIELSGTSAAMLAMSKAGVPKLNMLTDGTLAYFQAVSIPLLFYQGGTEVARIDTDFKLKYQSLEVGWRSLPMTVVSSFYNCGVSDKGKCVVQVGAAGVGFSGNTFDSGDVVTIMNRNAGAIGIATVGVTLSWGALTGARTLAPNGVVTALFVGLNTAVLTGSGLS